MTPAAASVEAARALAPLIREQADLIESERCLPPSILEALTEAGVFQFYVAQVFGGAEADPVTFCRVVEELAQADGSTGWCAMLCGSSGLFSGLLPEAAAREVFADPGAMVAGSLAPTGIARAVAGGYRLSGRWTFGSSIRHSSWVFGNCRVLDGDAPRLKPNGTPEVRILFFPQSDVEILDTWHVGGLRGTGSHDFQVQDLFVPVHRACSFAEEPVQPGPLYTLPLVTAAAALMASVALGIARHALDALEELAAVKTPARSQTVLREDPVARAQIGAAEGLLRAGRAFMYETIEQAWATALNGGRLSWKQRGLVRLAGTQAVTQALQAVDLACRTAGASSIYVSSPLERCLRDIRTAAQHHTVAPGNYELAGQLFLNFDLTGTFWGRDYRGDAP
jgi:indole-3-acetate monooxygenase